MYSLPSITHQTENKDLSPVTSISHHSRVEKKNITVRFELNELLDTVAQVYPEFMTIEDVLEDVATKFQLLPKYLSIKQKFGTKIPKTSRLCHLCTNDFGILDVKLDLSDLAQHINESIRNEHEKIRLDTALYYRQNLLPDFISVTIPAQTDYDKDGVLNARRIIVEIINVPIIKPFLGGYINKQTGLIYHNAYTQTGPLREQIKRHTTAGLLITRDTQTTDEPFVLNGMSQRFKAEPNDDELSADSKSQTAAIVLQRSIRLYLWKKFIHNLSIDRRYRNCRNDEKQCSIELSDDPDNDIAILVDSSPQTRYDFKLLQSKICKWKENKMEYIREHVDKDQQQVQFTQLLEEEIRLLNEIEKKRNKIRKEAYDKHMDKMLDKMGEPIKWIGYKNMTCEMDSLQCQMIRKLTTFYRQLKTPAMASIKIDRMEFLSQLHAVLMDLNSQSPLLNELLDLLDREQKLLLAGIDKETIESLRRRQNELFRNFIASQKVFRPTTKS